MHYLTPMAKAFEENDLEPMTQELNKLIGPFEYLSTLQPGENLQPTTMGRSWITRPLSGMEECPIQKTFSLGLGIYSTLTGAYSQDSFDAVIQFYTGEIHKAKTLFEDAIAVIQNFGTIEAGNDAKLRLLKVGKSAFWHVAVSCQGLHTWSETLSKSFSSDKDAREYRYKAINGLFLQQNVAICKIFKHCLQLFPKANAALADKIDLADERLSPMVEMVEDRDPAHFEKEAFHATKAAGECVLVTGNFIKNLRKFQAELLSHENEGRYEEKMQIKAYKSLMEKAEFVMEALARLSDEKTYDVASTAVVVETIDTLYNLFVNTSGDATGVAFIAELIKATIDIDLQTRGKISDLLSSEESLYFPESKNTLWQILAMQMVTSRFVMPLGELLKNAKKHPELVQHAEKVKQLFDLFLVAADLTNKSHS